MDLHKLREKFNRYLKENNIWLSRQRLDYSLRQYFRGLNLEGRSVLEIGAGEGLSCVWCVLHGADKVVALEPEASGSTKGMKRGFEKMAEATDLKGKVDYLPIAFGDYLNKNQSRSFDYILMQAVINHLDEEATKCLHLPEAEAERQQYRDTFKRMFDILKPNGVVVIYDVGRRNFWHDLKLKNPFSPTIEYDKHQQPKMWNELLCQAGFESIDTKWFTIYKLRHLRLLLSYWLPTYFLNSAFILRCKKPA